MSAAAPSHGKRRRSGGPSGPRHHWLRKAVYRLLDEGGESRWGMLLNRSIIVLILVTVTASVLESVPSLAELPAALPDLALTSR